MTRRVTIFVSYSHEDSIWVDDERLLEEGPQKSHKLIHWLKGAFASEGVEIWWDRQLADEPGEIYQARIERKIDAADIALLLLSQDFLISKFIQEVEIPRIRARVESGEMLLLPVLVGPIDWEGYEPFQWIRERQIIGWKDAPLTPLVAIVHDESKWLLARNEVLRAVRQRIADAMRRGGSSRGEQPSAGRVGDPAPPQSSAEIRAPGRSPSPPALRGRATALGLGAILVAALGAGALMIYFRRDPPAAALAIVEPRAGAVVEQSVTVRGTSSSPISTVVVVVHPMDTGGYWVQRQAVSTGPGTWQAAVTIGLPGAEDLGRKFEIVAFGNPKVSLSEGQELPAWPESEQRSYLVEVRR